MKIARKKVNEMLIGIQGVIQSREKIPAKFNYALNKTRVLLEAEAQGLESFNKTTFADYNSRIKAIEKEEKEATKETLTEIRKRNHELSMTFETGEYKEAFESWKKFLDEEVSVEVHCVKSSDIPDVLTAAQLNLLMPLIED